MPMRKTSVVEEVRLAQLSQHFKTAHRVLSAIYAKNKKNSKVIAMPINIIRSLHGIQVSKYNMHPINNA